VVKEQTMKQKLMVIALVSAAVIATQAQVQDWSRISDAARAEIERQAAVVSALGRVAVESRVTKGAPYAAESVTEFQQTLGDGNRISRRSVTKIYRDSEGRTRREQTNTSADGKETLSITIVDPVAGTSFTLDPEHRTAYKVSGIMAMPSMVPPAGARGGGGAARVGGPGTPGGVVAGPVPLPSERPTEASGRPRAVQERTPQGPSNTTKEELGQRMVEGVMADGTRTTTVIPAGAVGNDREIRVVSEQWLSSELGLLIATKHSDPRSGETTYRLMNIVRAEQDRSLFEVPADYTIQEGRGGGRGRGGVVVPQ
jgi:hypothetical protein